MAEHRFAQEPAAAAVSKVELERNLNGKIQDTLNNLQRAYHARPTEDGFDYETPLLHIMAQVQQLQRRVKEIFEREQLEEEAKQDALV